MARHRPSRRASSKIRDAVSPPQRYFCESLEQRLLFVVLHGGDVFEFYAENSHFERVVVTGNTTVELIGSHIDTMTAGFSLNGMQGVIFAGPDSFGTITQGPTTIVNGQVNGGFPPSALGNSGGGGGGTGGMTQTFSDNIFYLNIAQSDFTSRIAIADVPSLTTTPRPMQPFMGTITLRVNPTGISGVNPPFTVTSGANTGGALIGARTVNPPGAQNQDNIPIPQASIAAGLGQTFPQPVNNILQAGITMAAGNSLDAFLFGGTITGLVNLHGSVNTFYAGWIVTGQSDGEFDIGIISRPQNFNVDGNLHDLVTAGTIGSESDARNDSPDYVSGFDMHVNGVLGEVKTADSVIGAIDVTHSPSAPPLDGTPINELELKGPATFDPWDAALLGDIGFLHNDTFETPQILGPTDTSGDIQVVGDLQSLTSIAGGPDFVDYYAVPLLGGQRIAVQLSDLTVPVGTVVPTGFVGFLDVGVFDPYGRLIATDYSRVDTSQTQGQPFAFTAPRPGLYRFAVASLNNPDFVANPNIQQLGDFPYELSMSNVGDLAFGGIYAAANILDNPNVLTIGAPTPGNPGGLIFGNSTPQFAFHVENGDFGAAYAEGNVMSPGFDFVEVTGFSTPSGSQFGAVNSSVFSFGVDNGNLRAIQGAQIGREITAAAGGGPGGGDTGAAFGDIPAGNVPHGTVGLLRATGPFLGWNDIGAGSTATLAPQAALQVAVGGDYQMVDVTNGTLFADLVAQGNIGTIRANDMATNPASYFQVNAGNNTSRQGTIDLIDVKTDVGTLAAGGPAIITGPGGNMRYFHVGPGASVFRDLAFGGGFPEQTVYQPGETVGLTDDSGALVTLTPTSGTAATPATLTAETYPIRGSGGAAIINVTSTGSVDISTTGTGGTAEIGTIMVGAPEALSAQVNTGTSVTNNNNIQPGNQGGTGGGGGGITTAATRRTRRARRATAFPGPGQPGGAPIPGGSGGSTTGAGQPGGPPIPGTNGRFRLPQLPNPPTLSATGTPLVININGKNTDIYEITGPVGADGSLTAGLANVTAIVDNTGGEIPNIHLNSLGSITTNGSVGLLLRQGTGAELAGNVHNPLTEDGGNPGNPWNYPFLAPSNMIRVLGNIVSITAAKGIGNVYAGLVHMSAGDTIPTNGTPLMSAALPSIASGTDGNIGTITGAILGPVVAAGSINSVTAAGGVGPTPSGAVGGAGLFAVGVIGPVTSQGNFLGTICSSGSATNSAAGAAGQISLAVNGVIDQAVIANTVRFDYTQARAIGVVTRQNISPITFPIVDIGSVSARDGIIGTLVEGGHIGSVSSSDAGFGIFDSFIVVTGEGTVGSLSAGGYGIRATRLQGGTGIGSINVRGNGSNLPTTNFSPIVRRSETGVLFDPGTGLALNLLNDIDIYLGATATVHQIPGVTDSGVMEDSNVTGSRDLGSVTAWSIRGRNLNGLSFPDPNFKPLFPAQVTTFNLADRIGSINVAGPVRGLAIVTGRTGKFSFGTDVSGLNMTVAGPIGNVVFNGSLLSDSFITAQGPAGRIGSLTIHGSLDGGVRATQKINKLRIDGNLVGNVTAASLGTLSMGGGIGNGTLTIDTNVNTIQTDGDFGAGAGSALTINGSLQNLKVGRNFNGTLTVGGNLRNMTVNGSVLTGSNATIGNTLTLLKVGGDVQAGALIKAHIIKKTLVKGQTLGTIMTV